MSVITQEHIKRHKGMPSPPYPVMPQEKVIYDRLTETGCIFEIFVHPPCKNQESRDVVEMVSSCRFVRSELLINKGNTEFYMVMLPAAKPFKASLLTKQFGCSSLRQANKEEAMDLVGTTPGVMSPFALLFDKERKIKLLVDSELEDWYSFLCHPGTNTTTLRMFMDEFANKFAPSLGCKCYAIDLPRWTL